MSKLRARLRICWQRVLAWVHRVRVGIASFLLSRYRRVAQWFRRQGRARKIRFAVLALLSAGGLGLTIYGMDGDPKAAALNLGSGLIGAVITYLLIDLLVGETAAQEARKRELVSQMRSQVHDVAIAAVEELARLGHLHDGTLRGARLGGANLRGALLVAARLPEADLSGAYLEGVQLFAARLEGAFFIDARLEGAHLDGANLEGAYLMDAHLDGASLKDANLTGANLKRAHFGSETTLPDGSRWTQEIDLARFTDPMQPNYWKPQAPPG